MKEESWEKAIDLTTERLRTIVDEKGGDAVSGLVSSMHSNESLLFFRELMGKGIGAGSMDTLDGACFRTLVKARAELDIPFKESSWKMIPEADPILIVGADPYQTQPVISSLIRRTLFENRTKVLLIGQQAETFPFAALHLPLKEGDEPLLIQALLDGVLASKKDGAHKEQVAALLQKIGLDAADTEVFHEMVQTVVEADNPLFITGNGLIASADGSGLNSLVQLSRLKGLLPGSALRLVILKPFGNSSGAWKLGLASESAPSFGKTVTACVLFLAGEQVSNPDLLDRLTGLDFLAVISPYVPESLMDRIDVLIPCPMWLEEDGTYTSLDGTETGYKNKVIEPPSGVRDSWQVLSALAEHIGFRPDFETWNDLCKAAQKEMGG